MTFSCFLKKASGCSTKNRTLETNIEKMAHEIVHQSKREFYYVDMENVIQTNFTSIAVPYNFNYFRVQTGLKYVRIFCFTQWKFEKILCGKIAMEYFYEI